MGIQGAWAIVKADLGRGASIGGRVELTHPPPPTHTLTHTLVNRRPSIMPRLENEELCFSTSSLRWQPLQNSRGQLSASMDTRRVPLQGQGVHLAPQEQGISLVFHSPLTSKPC